MDLADRASADDEVYHAVRLSRRIVENVPAPSGACLNCDELLMHKDHRWCNADCRDDWFKRLKKEIV